MNYYEHHLADYTQATAHLSFTEDAAYSRMLRWYYANERPLPADIKQVERLVRAQSKQERDAVKAVLAEFFVLQDDGWHQDRSDREIARYQDKQRKASASANARWKKHISHSECNANASANAMRTHSDGNANASANAMRTHSDGNAHHTPDPRPQTKPSGSTHTITDANTPLPPDPGDSACDTTPAVCPTRAGAACLAMRKAGLPNANPSHPTLLALLEAGATDEELATAAAESHAKGKGFAYAIGTVKRRREEAAKLVLHKGKLPNGQQSVEERNRAVAAQWVPPELRQGAQA